jgi:peptidyl-prolyl cis-trans isomerase A (cyclophilin A)
MYNRALNIPVTSNSRDFPMSIRSIPLVLVTVLIAVFAALLPVTANATTVRVETVIGNFEINLYDNDTPETVANFLEYVQNGGYTDSFFHRSVPDFIVQSGGFRTDLNAQISAIPTNPAVANEPVFSNLRGTISMAKLGNQPNSATSQWFINLADNSAILDDQNGGFTAFGEVIGDGMTVVDALGNLPRFEFSAPLGELPLQNFTDDDYAAQVPVDNTHLIIVTAISVIDSTVDSAGAAGLNPTPNTLISTPDPVDPPAVDPPAVDNSGGGGGSLGLLTLLGLFAFGRKRVA